MHEIFHQSHQPIAGADGLEGLTLPDPPADPPDRQGTARQRMDEILTRLRQAPEELSQSEVSATWNEAVGLFMAMPRVLYGHMIEITAVAAEQYPSLLQGPLSRSASSWAAFEFVTRAAAPWVARWQVHMLRILLIRELGVHDASDFAMLDGALGHLLLYVEMRHAQSEAGPLAKASQVLGRYTAELDRLRQRLAGRGRPLRLTVEAGVEQELEVA